MKYIRGNATDRKRGQLVRMIEFLTIKLNLEMPDGSRKVVTVEWDWWEDLLVELDGNSSTSTTV